LMKNVVEASAVHIHSKSFSDRACATKVLLSSTQPNVSEWRERTDAASATMSSRSINFFQNCFHRLQLRAKALHGCRVFIF